MSGNQRCVSRVSGNRWRALRDVHEIAEQKNAGSAPPTRHNQEQNSVVHHDPEEPPGTRRRDAGIDHEMPVAEHRMSENPVQGVLAWESRWRRARADAVASSRPRSTLGDDTMLAVETRSERSQTQVLACQTWDALLGLASS